MIQSFYIHNFKNFEELILPQLKRVNLIVGKNNVGKSTLLEAMAVYLSEGDEFCLKDILQARGEELPYSRQIDSTQELVKDRLLSLFHDWKEDYSKDYCIKLAEQKDNPVTINQVYIADYRNDGITDGKTLYVYHQEDIDAADGKLTITTGGLLSQKANGGGANIIRYDHALPFASKPFKKIPYQMVHTVDFNSYSNATLYDKISLSPLEDYIVKALNIINENIDRITFVTEELRERYRVPVVSLKNSGKRVRLSSMGDGLNRVLTIILSLLNSKDGVLLLDEFETGLHYSVQKQLWEIIFMLAEELNIQVFVTSHSSDCLKTFSKTNTKEQGMLIRLEQRKSGITPVCYTDNKDIAFASENSIELR